MGVGAAITLVRWLFRPRATRGSLAQALLTWVGFLIGFSVLRSICQGQGNDGPPELLEQICRIAELEDRDFESVLEDAMRAYADSKQDDLLHHEAMKHLEASLEKNRHLGELLGET